MHDGIVKSVYQKPFEATIDYFFNIETNWLKESIQEEVRFFDDPKLSHQKKILTHYSNQKDTRLNIFVVGEGNYGKSTLINSLVKDEIAKVHFLPTTWCIHRYLFGFPKASVVSSKSIETMSHADAKRLLNSEEDKSRSNKAYDSPLKQIDWYYDNYPILKKIILVDTPGLAQLRTVLSENSIEDFYYKADCVLWILDATKINSESSLTSIKQVSRYSKKILGVINKWDRISEESRPTVMKIAQDTFGDYVIDFQPVSALLGTKNNLTESNIPELLIKIENLFMKESRKLITIQMYNTLKQTKIEAVSILENEIKNHASNADIYKSNTLYIRNQFDKIKNAINSKLRDSESQFLSNVKQKLQFRLTLNNAEILLKEIEGDSTHHYRTIANTATDLRNRNYYETIKYLTEKKYISVKYNYDGSINLLESIDNLQDLNPLKAIDNMKVVTNVRISLTSLFVEKIFEYIDWIPIIADLARNYLERKKTELFHEITYQIFRQSNDNFNKLLSDLMNQIETNYKELEESFERKFKLIFTSTDHLTNLIHETTEKRNYLFNDKFIWAKAIAKQLRTLYA